MRHADLPMSFHLHGIPFRIEDFTCPGLQAGQSNTCHVVPLKSGGIKPDLLHLGTTVQRLFFGPFTNNISF